VLHLGKNLTYRSNNNNIRFRSGNSNRGSGALHTPTSIHVHPNYNDSQSVSDYDIAVIQVTPAFNIGATAQIISLTSDEPLPGDNATISGWGVTSVSQVTYSEMSKVSNSLTYATD